MVQEPACSYDSAAKRVLSSDTVMLMDQLAVLKGVTRGLAERSHSCGDMRPGGNARFRRSSLDDCQRCGLDGIDGKVHAGYCGGVGVLMCVESWKRWGCCSAGSLHITCGAAAAGHRHVPWVPHRRPP